MNAFGLLPIVDRPSALPCASLLTELDKMIIRLEERKEEDEAMLAKLRIQREAIRSCQGRCWIRNSEVTQETKLD